LFPLQFYEENCLLEQRFVLDETKPVKAVLSSIVPGLYITSFLRMECGEGLKNVATAPADNIAALQQGSD
jgi:translation elongation factor EF-Ts